MCYPCSNIVCFIQMKHLIPVYLRHIFLLRIILELFFECIFILKCAYKTSRDNIRYLKYTEVLNVNGHRYHNKIDFN